MSIFARRDPRDVNPALGSLEIARRRAATACWEAGAEEAAMQAEYLWAVTKEPCGEQAARTYARYSAACKVHLQAALTLEETYR